MNQVKQNEIRGQRTIAQNNAIHKYCELVAVALNDAGLSVQFVLQNFKMDIEWNKDSVKEILWRNAQRGITGKYSTTELEKSSGEIKEIYEHINRFLGEKLHIEHIEFPSDEFFKEEHKLGGA